MHPSTRLVICLLNLGDTENLLAKSILDTAPAGCILTHLACRFDIAEAIIYERAAQYFGLPFSPVLPRDSNGPPLADRIEHLGQIRSLRQMVFDREVTFLAPDLSGFAALAKLRAANFARYRNVCIVPPKILITALTERNCKALLTASRQQLSAQWPFASAHLDLPMERRIRFTGGILVLVALAGVAPFWAQPLLLPVLLVLFLPSAWFRIVAILEPPPKRGKHAKEKLLADKDLPIYSVLIPLRDEAQMVPQLAAAMRRFDYPPEKLDIKFIVESASPETITAVNAVLGDPRFSLVVVPNAAPHTKPKALNYAMPLVRGRRVVVYDAEDVPEPDQLRKAATVFANDLDIDCLQAELSIDNGEESWISALFAAEYSGLFGIMLPAIDRWRLPMPLGGTSNHFRTRSLIEAGGWDAFNVTEDADIGIRLARLRYRIGTLHSKTYEEAPVTINAWLKQRTRWMKGWMQTYAVHNRKPLEFLRDTGPGAFIAYHVHVGSMIISAPLHITFNIALAVRFLLAFFFPDLAMGKPHSIYVFVFIAGYLGALTLSIAGALRLGGIKILLYQFLLPLYWLLAGVAAFRAMHELVVRPFFWSKTTHGVTNKKRGAASATDLPTTQPSPQSPPTLGPQ